MSGSLSDEWNKIDWNKAFIDKCRESYQPSEDKSQWLDPIMQKPYEYTDPFPEINARLKHLEANIKEHHRCLDALEATIAKLENLVYRIAD